MSKWLTSKKVATSDLEHVYQSANNVRNATRSFIRGNKEIDVQKTELKNHVFHPWLCKCAMGHAYIVDNSPWSKYIIFYIYILHISYFAPNIIFLVQWGRIDILLTAPSWSKWPHLNIETSVPSQPNANPIIGLSIYFKYDRNASSEINFPQF